MECDGYVSDDMILPYIDGHPLHGSHGHVSRDQKSWPKYIGKRLPDTRDLSSSSALSDEERMESREAYAEGVLVLFYPFRVLSDLHDEETTWWSSYLKRKIFLESNVSTRKILRNFQNFYESFCRSSVCDPAEEDEEETTGFDRFDDDDNVVDLADIDENLVVGGDAVDVILPVGIDPLVAKLLAFADCPLSLSVMTTGDLQFVRTEDALSAVQHVKSATSVTGFMLPGRRAEFLLSTSFDGLPHVLQNDKKHIHPPVMVGTRIQLLEDIVCAIDIQTSNPLFSEIGLP